MMSYQVRPFKEFRIVSIGSSKSFFSDKNMVLPGTTWVVQLIEQKEGKPPKGPGEAGEVGPYELDEVQQIQTPELHLG